MNNKRKMKMKKLMCLFGVIAASCAVHGASLSWAVSQVQNSDGTSGAAAGYRAYMFVTAATGNTLSFVEGASLTTADAVQASILNGTFDASIAYHDGLSNSGGGYTTATGVSSDFNAGDSITAFVVIFDAADYASANNYIITAEKSTSWTSATGIKMLAYGSQANATWMPISNIPEPTSGLLMLVGLAGLALRRRRA